MRVPCDSVPSRGRGRHTHPARRGRALKKPQSRAHLGPRPQLSHPCGSVCEIPPEPLLGHWGKGLPGVCPPSTQGLCLPPSEGEGQQVSCRTLGCGMGTRQNVPELALLREPGGALAFKGHGEGDPISLALGTKPAGKPRVPWSPPWGLLWDLEEGSRAGGTSCFPAQTNPCRLQEGAEAQAPTGGAGTSNTAAWGVVGFSA